MAESVICQKSVSTICGDKRVFTSIKKSRQSLRNLKRRNRRKRNKLRYYKNLRQLRYQRKSDDLCSQISVIDITDMDWIPIRESNGTTDVAEWHNKEQIAYWKSKALSLEYENRMLLQHIRNIYAKQTQDYANYMLQQQQQQLEGIQEAQQEQHENKSGSSSSGNDVDDGNCDNKDAVFRQPPKEQIGKKRREEMEKLYGQRAVKIIGLETDMQLNYDKLVQHHKPQYWPSLPLKLEF